MTTKRVKLSRQLSKQTTAKDDSSAARAKPSKKAPAIRRKSGSATDTKPANAGPKPVKRVAAPVPVAPRTSQEGAAAPESGERDDKFAGKKLVRDSFTMPRADYALIGQLKQRALEGMRPAKKSELLRAGLWALERLDAAALVAALNALRPIRAGRPKKV